METVPKKSTRCLADFMIDCSGRTSEGTAVQWSLWLRGKTIKEITSADYSKMPLAKVRIGKRQYAASPEVWVNSRVKLPTIYLADSDFSLTYGGMRTSLSNVGVTVRGSINWGSSQIQAQYYMTVPMPVDTNDRPTGTGKIEYFVGDGFSVSVAEGSCRSGLRILRSYWEGPDGKVGH